MDLFGLNKAAPHDDSVELLMTANNEIELSIVRSILDAEGVPYMVKERGSGGSVKVIMGHSVFGSDVFVPKELYEKALELWNAYRYGEIVEDEGEAPEDDEV